MINFIVYVCVGGGGGGERHNWIIRGKATKEYLSTAHTQVKGQPCNSQTEWHACKDCDH